MVSERLPDVLSVRRVQEDSLVVPELDRRDLSLGQILVQHDVEGALEVTGDGELTKVDVADVVEYDRVGHGLRGTSGVLDEDRAHRDREDDA